MFARKGLAAAPPAGPQDGYEWVDAHMGRYAQPGSDGFAQELGNRLFDSAYHALREDRGTRIENLIAMLSSVGGFACLMPILDALRDERRSPQDIGMAVVTGRDGHSYYLGDAPNRLLCESHLSLLSLVYGAAHQYGAAVSVQMIHDEMKIVASRLGQPEFLELDLPEEHRVDNPLNWVRVSTPFVLRETGKHFSDIMSAKLKNLPEGMQVPPFIVHRIIGFAIQRAIDIGHDSLDPTMIARIATGCAIRAAKLDPEWVAAGQS